MLLEKAGTTTLQIEGLRLIALGVFKSLHGLNPLSLNDMFTPKYVPYQIRDTSLFEHSRYRTTAFGRSSKLGNEFPNDFNETADITDFKSIL